MVLLVVSTMVNDGLTWSFVTNESWPCFFEFKNGKITPTIVKRGEPKVTMANNEMPRTMAKHSQP